MSTKSKFRNAVVHGAVPLAYIGYLEERGENWTALARRAGLPPEKPKIDEYLPFASVCAFCEECARALGDDALGLKVGYTAPIGAGNFADYVATTASTIEQSIRNWVRFEKISVNIRSTDLEFGPDFLRMSFKIPEQYGPSVQYTGVVIGYVLSRLRHMSQQHDLNLQVGLTRSKPRNIRDYIEIAGPEISFGRETESVGIPAEILARRPSDSDPTLNGIIENSAMHALQRIEQGGNELHRITTQICDGLKDGDASLDTVSRKLGMSRRTLQRHLEGANTSYRQLVEDVRKSLAERYLTEANLQISEVAYLLGYSELSAFSRAVKVWFGVSPSVLRVRGRSEDPKVLEAG
jgi:AraC-like DNA-binding protein